MKPFSLPAEMINERLGGALEEKRRKTSAEQNNFEYMEEKIMQKSDLILLIEAEDELYGLDKALEQLAGHGHASGEFVKLDNVYSVIQNNSHPSFTGSDMADQAFYRVLTSREKTPEERAEILLNGLI